ncbi:sugar transferase [Marinifilum fragile]|uniref:sugar transferase n=1 Tax=Marinifilum fragile TaxID=570161 RepID=UPI002AA65188|nr:sugar transferase [Marinifilum fragile]
MYLKYYKRIIDWSAAFIGLSVFSPVLIFMIFFLAIANRGTPFFTQIRPGRCGKPFRIIKFKTMSDRKDLNGNLLPDADRLTTIGAFVRKTSLDELPQLINVLKGDIAIVGPRPLLMEYLPLYNEDQARRHEVKPGITGWAQVNGRNAISWEEKFRLDVEYVDSVSFQMDLKILIMTIKKVFLREGVNSNNHVTAERFAGTNQ